MTTGGDTGHVVATAARRQVVVVLRENPTVALWYAACTRRCRTLAGELRMRTFALAAAALLGGSTVVFGQTLDTKRLPDEVADEVVQLFNAPGTQRVEGRFVVESGTTVERDLVVLGGPLTISGHLLGRVVAVNATVEFLEGARVDGDLLVVGGEIVGRDRANITGSVRTYSAALSYDRDGERLSRRPERSSDDFWWRRRDRWRNRGWGDLKLISARTYNRVEGLPIQFGPVFGRQYDWGRLSIDALGIYRSADSFEWEPENIGHTVRTELRLGRGAGIKIGARHFDVVDAVEPWQLSDSEVGLASFFLHRDYRDYFDRHGGTVYASVFPFRDFELGGSFSHQRWGARSARDPWTLFRDAVPWRANPRLDEGKFHIATATVRFDTRNDDRSPWSGWLINAEYELGNGRVSNYAPTSPGTRVQTVGGLTSWDRALVDVRRYNRIAPNAQINFRVAAGGWLNGDDLPLQRRFGLGGPGTMPGFDFRRGDIAALQTLTCGVPGATPSGIPAECERFALGQVEFRGDLRLDPFGILSEDRDWRRRGWGRGTQWVIFADAGRGWLVGSPDGKQSFGKNEIPKLSSFQTDVGLGIVLDDLGLYVAKAVSQSQAPVNFFVRLRPRF